MYDIHLTNVWHILANCNLMRKLKNLKTMDTFRAGTLAEKARLAETLMAEVFAGVPDDVLDKSQDGLKAGAAALRIVQNMLREKAKSVENVEME